MCPRRRSKYTNPQTPLPQQTKKRAVRRLGRKSSDNVERIQCIKKRRLGCLLQQNLLVFGVIKVESKVPWYKNVRHFYTSVGT